MYKIVEKGIKELVMVIFTVIEEKNHRASLLCREGWHACLSLLSGRPGRSHTQIFSLVRTFLGLCSLRQAAGKSVHASRAYMMAGESCKCAVGGENRHVAVVGPMWLPCAWAEVMVDLFTCLYLLFLP